MLRVPEKEGDTSKWKDFIEVGPEDAMTSGPAGFDKTGQVRSTCATAAIATRPGCSRIDLKTGEKKLVAEDPRADVGGVLVHPTEKTIQAVSFTYDRTEWKILDPAIERRLSIT